MQTFCTIITSSHLPFAHVLSESLKQHDASATLQVLITDGEPGGYGDLRVHTPSELTGSKYYSTIEKKYGYTHQDHFRWALKPVFLGYLLEKGYTKVIFLDPDIYFVNSFQFLFELLDEYNILLTPHWADLDFTKNPDSVLSVMKGGLYNAGFIAANNNALSALEWWAGLCSEHLEKNPGKGLFDDQKFLDLLPVQFEKVHVLKHQGCNLASWNIQTCKRELDNGRLMINGKYEPIFIHFAKDTIVNILNRNDILLKPFLDEYKERLSRHGFQLMDETNDLSDSYDSSYYQVKHKLRLRTRLKRFLYNLAKKL